MRLGRADTSVMLWPLRYSRVPYSPLRAISTRRLTISWIFPTSRRTATSDAVGFLLDAIRRQPGQLTVIATAPLTNIALAIEKDARTMRNLRALIVMGGAVRVPGNVGPVSEFNFAADPEAAAIVLQAGLPLTLVPLDVTERVVLTRDLLSGVSPAGRLRAIVEALAAETMAFHLSRGEPEGIVMHDPLAVRAGRTPARRAADARSGPADPSRAPSRPSRRG